MIRGNVRHMTPALMRERSRMGRVVPPSMGAALCQCGDGGGIGCCGSSARTMGTIGDPQSDFYAAIQGKATQLGGSAAAQIKAQTGIDVKNQRVQQGAAAALELAQNGFNPNNPADVAKMIHAIAGGLALIPGPGTLLAGALEGMFAVGMAISCPTMKLAADLGLGDLPPECGGAPCKSSGNWTTASILHSNAGQLPTMRTGSFQAFVIGALATSAAQAANCKGGMPPGVIVDAAVSIWNQTHAGPSVGVLVPPLNQVNQGITAFGSPVLITAWQNVSGTSGPAARAGKDPYAYYAFAPVSSLQDHPSGRAPSSGAWTPYPVAPKIPGENIDPPRVVQVNTGAALPPPAPAAPAAPHKTLMFKLGPPAKPAAPAGPSTAAKVATYAAAGGTLYALIWWLWKNGWKWVAPDWSDVVKAFK